MIGKTAYGYITLYLRYSKEVSYAHQGCIWSEIQ